MIKCPLPHRLLEEIADSNVIQNGIVTKESSASLCNNSKVSLGATVAATLP